MRCMIIGGGPVGIYYGTQLATAGQPVVFVVRDESLAALREQGARVERDGTLICARVEAVTEPVQAGPCDVVLVTVKSMATQGVAYLLSPVVRADTVVLSLQSGIENDEILAATLGVTPLVQAVTDLISDLVEPGLVCRHRGGGITVGEADGRRSPRLAQLAECFASAGIAHECTERIAAARWTQLAWEAAFDAGSALHRCTVGEMIRRPAARAQLHATMQEVVAVANASGVAVEPAHIEPAIARSAEELADVRLPMLQDLERGWPSEVEALNGTVVRAAARVGVSVPVNQLLYRLLTLHDRTARRRFPGVFKID